MRIGVVSDTHARELPQQMLNDFAGVDLIVHAGDVGSSDILRRLEQIAPVKAVYGNMDSHQMRQQLARRQIIPCGRFSIGLFHGEGPPKSLLNTVREEFKGQKVDAVIFGHSHCSMNECIDNILFFNPGSPNDNVCADRQSYGILDTNDEIVGKIIEVK